jgi:hypothetical protein
MEECKMPLFIWPPKWRKDVTIMLSPTPVRVHARFRNETVHMLDAAGQPRLAYGDKGEEGRYEVLQTGDSIISVTLTSEHLIRFNFSYIPEIKYFPGN